MHDGASLSILDLDDRTACDGKFGGGIFFVIEKDDIKAPVSLRYLDLDRRTRSVNKCLDLLWAEAAQINTFPFFRAYLQINISPINVVLAILQF